MVNALALRGDEGRDKLRKAAGRSKYPLYPQVSEWGNPLRWRRSIRSNTEANPENWNILVPGGKENKSDSPSSGDRTGNSPNLYRFGGIGVEGPLTLLSIRNGIFLESETTEGDSPVRVTIDNIRGILSRSGHVKSWLKLPGPSGKAKYFWETDSEPVPWGKGEKNPEQGSEIVPETVRLQPVGAILRCGDGVPFA